MQYKNPKWRSVGNNVTIYLRVPGQLELTWKRSISAICEMPQLSKTYTSSIAFYDRCTSVWYTFAQSLPVAVFCLDRWLHSSVISSLMAALNVIIIPASNMSTTFCTICDWPAAPFRWESGGHTGDVHKFQMESPLDRFSYFISYNIYYTSSSSSSSTWEEDWGKREGMLCVV